MGKLKLVALIVYSSFFMSTSSWANTCCKWPSPMGCGSPASEWDCKNTIGSKGKFFENRFCCTEGKQKGNCIPDGKSCDDNGNLSTLSSFVIVSLQQGSFDLRWETLSELHNAGFFIWRGIKEGDEYKDVHRVSELLPAEGNFVGGATYSYKDTISDFQEGTVYCYGLEDIDTRGISTYHYDFVRCFPQ